MNLPTIIVAAVVALSLIATAVSALRRRHAGKSSCACGGDCSRCSHCGH